MSNDLTKQKQTVPAVVTEQHNVDTTDLLLPRAELLQAMSPKMSQNISGELKPGMLVDNLEGRPLSEEKPNEAIIIPLKVEKNFIRWFPRTEGGGIMYRTNNPNDPRVLEDTKWIGREKPKCTQYLNFLCLVQGRTLPLVVSFAMTSYTAGRKLLTMCETGLLEGRAYWHSRYRLYTLQKTNNFGTFFVLCVDKTGPSTPEERANADRVLQMFGGKELSFEQESAEQTPTNNFGDEF